ncbi:hypothetical protein V7O62_07185 [Methanolobus sp. ZRKC2]|uniref:hypothetical protein n=1 Tax=Methanolobus sp. ZRKC2 TaxID=3125783 RepID=UPI0032444C81
MYHAVVAIVPLAGSNIRILVKIWLTKTLIGKLNLEKRFVKFLKDNTLYKNHLILIKLF